MTSAGEPIVLQGKPANLTGRLGFASPARRAVIELELPDAFAMDRSVPADILASENGRGSLIVARLDRSLAPGAYEGELAIDETVYPVRAEVAARAHARLAPRRFDAEAAPGAEVDFKVAVVNDGNVELVVPADGEIELYPPDVFERREAAELLALFEFPPEPAHEAALAASSAGCASVTVLEGAGPLASADARGLAVRVALPRSLACGDIFEGSWPVLGRSLTFAVRTIAKS